MVRCLRRPGSPGSACWPDSTGWPSASWTSRSTPTAAGLPAEVTAHKLAAVLGPIHLDDALSMAEVEAALRVGDGRGGRGDRRGRGPAGARRHGHRQHHPGRGPDRRDLRGRGRPGDRPRYRSRRRALAAKIALDRPRLCDRAGDRVRDPRPAAGRARLGRYGGRASGSWWRRPAPAYRSCWTGCHASPRRAWRRISQPGVLGWCAAGHRSTEPSQRLALDKLGLEPHARSRAAARRGQRGRWPRCPCSGRRCCSSGRWPGWPISLRGAVKGSWPALRLAVGTLTVLPVGFRSRRPAVAGRAMLLAPLAVAPARRRVGRRRLGGVRDRLAAAAGRAGRRRGAGARHPGPAPGRSGRHGGRPGFRLGSRTGAGDHAPRRHRPDGRGGVDLGARRFRPSPSASWSDGWPSAVLLLADHLLLPGRRVGLCLRDGAFRRHGPTGSARRWPGRCRAARWSISWLSRLRRDHRGAGLGRRRAGGSVRWRSSPRWSGAGPAAAALRAALRRGDRGRDGRLRRDRVHRALLGALSA